MPASAEFVDLCRSQVSLLTGGLGAALSIVYLAEEFSESTETNLAPIVAYPEEAATWSREQVLAMLSMGSYSEKLPRLPQTNADRPEPPLDLPPPDHPPDAALEDNPQQKQIVLPLIQDGMVMGLLVTARSDRPWSAAEQEQIEQIADTLTVACVMDQRSQWLAEDLRHYRELQRDKSDLLDALLHQFRNPLTAIRTFGKLLLKRLQAEDANRSPAEGIVRESDRLQELLKQFDVALDLDRATVPSLSAAPEWEAQLESAPAAAASNPSMRLLPGANLLTGTPDLQLHWVREVLAPLLDSALAIAHDRQLDLQAHIPEDLPPVRTDVKALREILTNLLDNALKYTPAEGQVVVKVLSQPDRPHQAIVIADTGPGIPTTDQSHLFERGYRGVQSQSAIAGSGLGLAIVRDLLDQIQGEIEVFTPADASGFVPRRRKQAPGTAFVVWLPEVRSLQATGI